MEALFVPVNPKPMRGFVLFFLLTSPSVFSQVTYYVAPGGNDQQSGLSPATAFLTLQHAADLVNPGDSVRVAQGDYVGFDLRSSGTAQNPIVFWASEDSVRVLTKNPVTDDGINLENADWIEINGFTVKDMPRNGIRVVLSDHVIVRHNHCTGNFERGIFTGFANDILIEHNVCTHSIDEHGIYFSNSADRPIIRFNTCHHNRGAGIQINADASLGGDGITTDAHIEGNVLYENGVGGGAAINLDGAVRASIVNNLLYDNHATGIALFQIDAASGSKDARIFHNTILQPDDGRWCLLVNDASTGAAVYNNILLTEHSFRGCIAVSSSSVAGFSSDHNLLCDRLSDQGDGNSISFAAWQGLGYDSHSLLAGNWTDIFQDTANQDYRLGALSPARDAGTDSFLSIVSVDLLGLSRSLDSAPDLGPYEFPGQTGLPHWDRPPVRWYQVANEIRFLGLSAKDRIRLWDMSGRLLTDQVVDAAGKMKATGLPTGMYVFRVWSRKGEQYGAKLSVR